MPEQPLWTQCIHLSAGTCPELIRWGQELGASNQRRPELNQDLALERLGQACAGCALRPDREETA